MKAVRIFLLALFTIAALAYLNIIIPKPQSTDARTYDDDHGFQAQEFPCNQGSCVSTAKVLKIAVHETPACTSGTLSSLAGYKGAAWFQNESSDTYKYHVVWGSYFCANATTGSCTSGQLLNSTDFTLSPGGTTQTYSPARNESNLTCGKVQTDMSFQAWKKVGSNWVLALSYGNLSNPGSSNATYTYCNTGKVCSNPTPTPTKPVTPTPTKPVTPTPTTPVTPTVTPTATPTTSVTPTVTPTGTVTPTPTTVVTPTPTTTEGCTSNCGNTTNITVEQQQQQQLVLAASVAPAPTTTQLPSTGADDFAVIGTLLSLFPIGWKIKKLI